MTTKDNLPEIQIELPKPTIESLHRQFDQAINQFVIIFNNLEKEADALFEHLAKEPNSKFRYKSRGPRPLLQALYNNYGTKFTQTWLVDIVNLSYAFNIIYVKHSLSLLSRKGFLDYSIVNKDFKVNEVTLYKKLPYVSLQVTLKGEEAIKNGA